MSAKAQAVSASQKPAEFSLEKEAFAAWLGKKMRDGDPYVGMPHMCGECPLHNFVLEEFGQDFSFVYESYWTSGDEGMMTPYPTPLWANEWQRQICSSERRLGLATASDCLTVLAGV